MITWAIVAGAILGLCIAVARRYPWYGALCLFVGLTLLCIFVAELAHTQTGRPGIFGVLVVLPYGIYEGQRTIKKRPLNAVATKYVYAAYASSVALALWGIYRTIEIFSQR